MGLIKQIRSVEGARSVQTELSRARRSLRGNSPNKASALTKIDSAIQKFEEELAWRRNASASVLPALERYEQTIRGTIGLRQQRRLPEDFAVDVAGCMSYHEDVSLYF